MKDEQSGSGDAQTLTAFILKPRREQGTTGCAGRRVLAAWDGPGNSGLHTWLVTTLILRALLVASDCAFLPMHSFSFVLFL